MPKKTTPPPPAPEIRLRHWCCDGAYNAFKITGVALNRLGPSVCLGCAHPVSAVTHDAMIDAYDEHVRYVAAVRYGQAEVRDVYADLV